MHDFLIKEIGRVVPYGIYDPAANAGLVTSEELRAFSPTAWHMSVEAATG